jgi:outer membrane receptor protein involved in Fe transport
VVALSMLGTFWVGALAGAQVLRPDEEALPVEPDPDEDLFEDDELFDDEDLFEEDDLSDADPEPEKEDASAAPEPSAGSDATPESEVSPGRELEAIAPTQQGPTEGLEEIVVEGQMGSGIDVEAPVSATTFGSEELDALGVQDVSDLAAYTPNTEIRTTGATSVTFFIRGVGLNDFTANGEGAIAIYQDDVALSLPAIQLGQLYDVDNVNVLRGPQGSGPGRNGSGGAIHIKSARPRGEHNGFVRGEFGRYSAVDVEGAMGVPLITDVLSTRLSFRVSERDPFVRNGCPTDLGLNLDDPTDPINLERVADRTTRNQPSICNETERFRIVNEDRQPGEPSAYNISPIRKGLPSQVNNLDRWAARGQLRFQPEATDLDLLFSFHGARVDQLTRVGQAIGTGGSFVNKNGETVVGLFGGNAGGYRPEEIVEQELRIRERLGVQDFPVGSPERSALLNKAKVILARKLSENLDERPFYGDYNNPSNERMESYGGLLKADWEHAAFHLANTLGFENYDRYRNTDSDYTPNNLFEARIIDRAWQVSEDLRLSGELDLHPIEWESGVYFLAHELDFDRRDEGSTNLRSIYVQHTYSAGIYAGGSWELLDDFTLEGGARYNLERKTFDSRLFRSSLTPRPDANRPCKEPQLDDCDADRLVHAPTGSLSLTYHATDALSFYWKYSRGWKSAQFSGGGIAVTFDYAKPETVDSFEIGFSGSWFDGRLTARASGFHYTYEDYQVFITRTDVAAPPSRVVVNADDAILYGAEIDASLEPVDALRLNVRGGWIESEFLDFSLQTLRTIPRQLPDPPVLASVDQDYSGNRLPNTPRFTVSGSAQYAMDLGRYGTLTPRWDFSWSADVFFDQTEGRGNPNDEGLFFLPKYAIGQRDYWLHNLRLAYLTPSGDIEIAGWVRNLDDKVYKALAFDASAAGVVGNIPGDPRTYGISVLFNW